MLVIFSKSLNGAALFSYLVHYDMYLKNERKEVFENIERFYYYNYFMLVNDITWLLICSKQ